MSILSQSRNGIRSADTMRKTNWTILSLLIALAVCTIIWGIWSLIPRPSRSNVDRLDPRQTIQQLCVAINLFNLDCDSYPTTEMGLMALIVNPGVSNWGGPYMERIPDDLWGVPYRYSLRTNGRYKIRSAGPDKRFGTPDDLTN